VGLPWLCGLAPPSPDDQDELSSTANHFWSLGLDVECWWCINFHKAKELTICVGGSAARLVVSLYTGIQCYSCMETTGILKNIRIILCLFVDYT
jgi:hypothetical protein